MKHFLLALFLFVSAAIYGNENPILETRQIHLREYPGAFNPSIIALDRGYLLTFRTIPNPKEYWISKIGVVILNDFFQPVTAPELLDTRKGRYLTPSQSEDARVFMIGKEIYLMYNDNLDCIHPSGQDRREIFVAKVQREGDHFTLLAPQKLIYPTKYILKMWEKNWVPFEYNNELLIAYTIVPHEIVTPDFTRGVCKKITTSTALHPWNWGTLRGGTPAILLDGEYLSFFHSSLLCGGWAEQKWKYFLGAYMFSPEPPFEITQMTKTPLEADTFYHPPSNYHKTVIFPGGFVVKGPNIYLVYGKDDSQIWIATIDLEKLKKALVPIEICK